MQCAVSVPKRIPEEGSGADGALLFCSVKEGFSAMTERCAGKILVVSDRERFPAVASAVRTPRAVSAVLCGDALPLFAMPPCSGVFAVGGRDVMLAARLYAGVNRTPCVLFPAETSLFGVFEERAEVAIGEDLLDGPLAQADVFFDETLLSDPAEGYAHLLLARLSLFEGRAIALFGGEGRSERGFEALLSLDSPDLRNILQKNALLRRADFHEGEGRELARTYGAFAAFESLMKLYVAFFRDAIPQTYTVPDYERRARAAGVPYAEVSVPTVGAFARRALVLGGRRAQFLRELTLISQKMHTYRRNYRSLGGTVVRIPPRELNFLPERENGLSAIIRDFGLLERL